MLLKIYFYECNDILDVRRSKLDPKYDPTNVTLDAYNYKGDEENLDDLPLPEGNEEVKERKGWKILTPKKLWKVDSRIWDIFSNWNSF